MSLPLELLSCSCCFTDGAARELAAALDMAKAVRFFAESKAAVEAFIDACQSAQLLRVEYQLPRADQRYRMVLREEPWACQQTLLWSWLADTPAFRVKPPACALSALVHGAAPADLNFRYGAFIFTEGFEGISVSQ